LAGTAPVILAASPLTNDLAATSVDYNLGAIATLVLTCVAVLGFGITLPGLAAATARGIAGRDPGFQPGQRPHGVVDLGWRLCFWVGIVPMGWLLIGSLFVDADYRPFAVIFDNELLLWASLSVGIAIGGVALARPTGLGSLPWWGSPFERRQRSS
jgi:type IV secretory pathway TrbD component